MASIIRVYVSPLILILISTYGITDKKSGCILPDVIQGHFYRAGSTRTLNSLNNDEHALLVCSCEEDDDSTVSVYLNISGSLKEHNFKAVAVGVRCQDDSLLYCTDQEQFYGRNNGSSFENCFEAGRKFKVKR